MWSLRRCSYTNRVSSNLELMNETLIAHDPHLEGGITPKPDTTQLTPNNTQPFTSELGFRLRGEGAMLNKQTQDGRRPPSIRATARRSEFLPPAIPSAPTWAGARRGPGREPRSAGPRAAGPGAGHCGIAPPAAAPDPGEDDFQAHPDEGRAGKAVDLCHARGTMRFRPPPTEAG
jgi:hypothetical protein